VSDALQEIIVTANKREENVEKVGVTITALSADETGITPDQETRRNSHRSFPVCNTLPRRTTRRSTRCAESGYNADALAVYPAVSVYLDQAPMPFPVLAGHTLYEP